MVTQSVQSHHQQVETLVFAFRPLTLELVFSCVLPGTEGWGVEYSIKFYCRTRVEGKYLILQKLMSQGNAFVMISLLEQSVGIFFLHFEILHFPC